MIQTFSKHYSYSTSWLTNAVFTVGKFAKTEILTAFSYKSPHNNFYKFAALCEGNGVKGGMQRCKGN